MKNKKGFTLIELLAVIVILAIIALIAMPIVLNMINNARKKSAESSAYGFIEAIEYNNGFAQTEQAGYTEITGTDLDITGINVKMKGKKPTSGTVTIDLTGKVTSANLCVEGYQVTYTNKEVTEVKKGCSSSSSSSSSNEPEPSTPTYTAYSVGDSINYNPVTGAINCENPVSTTGTKEGCMKWYVISASGTNDTTVDVILDHNTTATVAWVTQADYADDTNWSSNKNSKGPITANAQLATDTTGWTSGLNPRLITANEIAAITGNTGWSSSTATSSDWFCLDTNAKDESTWCAKASGTSNYKWLFDYTNGCTSSGCDNDDSSTYGYWTSSPVSGSSGRAWLVSDYGRLDYYYVDNVINFGVRPVITIQKSQID